jgi:hypothetical protein
MDVDSIVELPPFLRSRSSTKVLNTGAGAWNSKVNVLKYRDSEHLVR